MNNAEQLLKELDTAIVKEDVNKLNELIIQIDDILLEEGDFSIALFDGIIKLIQKDEFLKLSKSWYLLKLFEENIEILSLTQKDVLFKKLQAIFHSIKDATASFLVVEIIVDLYPEKRAFEALARLNACQEKNNRALIPHGFQHFIKKSKDSKLANSALIELKKFASDSDKHVREQATFEYSTLKKVKAT
jgi:hypothetical protein